MPWTAPRTWAATDTPTASALNTDLRDNTNFLHDPPTCRVTNSTAFTISSSSTWTAVTFNTERWDTDTMHDTGSNTSRITFKTAGKYLIGGHIQFAANATGDRRIRINVNNGTVVSHQTMDAAATGASTIETHTLWNVALNDYAELEVWQSSGGALDVDKVGAGHSPEFWAIWISG